MLTLSFRLSIRLGLTLPELSGMVAHAGGCSSCQESIVGLLRQLMQCLFPP